MCYELPYREPKFANNASKYIIDYILNLDSYGDYWVYFCCRYTLSK